MTRTILVLTFTVAAILIATADSPTAHAAPQTTDIPVESAALQIIKEIPLSTDIPGILEYVDPAEEGRVVKAGQEVIRLLDDVVRAELESARRKAEFTTDIDFAIVALEKARIDLEIQEEKNAANPRFPPFTEAELRQSRLEVQKSEAQLQKAHDDVEVLQLDVKTKEAQLKQYSVVSPIDGIVTAVNRFPGQAVRQGDSVITVTDVTTLRAVLKVSFQYRDQIAIGQPVEIRILGTSTSARRQNASAVPSTNSGSGLLSNAPGLRDEGPLRSPATTTPTETPTNFSNPASAETFTGTITFIVPRVDPNSQLIEVYANVPNRIKGDRYLLNGGMNISATIKSDRP